MSVAEWVRHALELARRPGPVKSVVEKLAVIPAAVKYDCPSGDIGDMLAEIERGYGNGVGPCFQTLRW